MAASLRVPFFLFMLLHAILFLSNPVNCNEEEDELLQGINDYRKCLKLSHLEKNEKSACLADQIANKLLEDQPATCNGTHSAPRKEPQLSDCFPGLVKKCKIHINTTGDGKILSACVPKLDSSLVLSNFTDPPYSKYLNDSKYSGIGIGSKHDWIVVILSKNTTGGSFTGAAACMVSKVGLGHYLLSLLLGLFLVLTTN